MWLQSLVRKISFLGKLTANMLSQHALSLIDHEVNKYPVDRKQSAVIAALAIAQDEHGWLSPDVMHAVADYLDMAPMAVYEVASFYEMFNLKPMGRHKITLCTNLPCALSGALETQKHLMHKLGIGFNEVTPDGRYSLKEGQCFGACGDAPVLLVNNKAIHCKMSISDVDQLLEDLK
jgi:NADH-quinone oxidoreductase subunit E